MVLRMPACAGRVVSDEGADAAAELEAASTAVTALAVLDAVCPAKLPAEAADTRAGSSSSKAPVELVRSAVAVAASSDDQATLELMGTMPASPPAPPASLGLSAAVNPTPPAVVPPNAPATTVVELSAAWSARPTDGGVERATEAAAVVATSVASQPAGDARASVVDEVAGRMPSAG